MKVSFQFTKADTLLQNGKKEKKTELLVHDVESLIIVCLVARKAHELNFRSTKYISSASSYSCISIGRLVPIFPEISEFEPGADCYQNSPAPIDGNVGTQQTPAQNLTASGLSCSWYYSVFCVRR